MPDSFLSTLRDWQNFYFMLGGAAATLMGLIFVAVSLGASLISEDTRADIETYVTPILFYFVSTFVIALVMLMPITAAGVVAVLLLLAGLVGVGQLLWVIGKMWQANRQEPVSWGHWWWHAVVPGFSYLCIAGAAAGLLSNAASLALFGLALGCACLLVSGIWRAWELILWIGHQRVAGN